MMLAIPVESCCLVLDVVICERFIPVDLAPDVYRFSSGKDALHLRDQCSPLFQ